MSSVVLDTQSTQASGPVISVSTESFAVSSDNAHAGLDAAAHDLRRGGRGRAHGAETRGRIAA